MKTHKKMVARLGQAVLLALPLALGVCAPSATSRAATVNSAQARLDVAAGQSAVVSLRSDPDTMGIDASEEQTLDIDFTSTDGFGRVQDKEVAVPWFSVTGAAPQGWSAQLQTGFYGYTIVKTQDNGSGGTSGVRYRNVVRLVIEVTAPPSAAAGNALVLVSVRNVNGKTAQLPVFVTVHR